MWNNGINCKYMFLFPLKNLAHKGLIRNISFVACSWNSDLLLYSLDAKSYKLIMPILPEYHWRCWHSSLWYNLLYSPYLRQIIICAFSNFLRLSDVYSDITSPYLHCLHSLIIQLYSHLPRKRNYRDTNMHGVVMTSSNENIFDVSGPLWGESTGDRWIPLTKATYAEL